MRKLVVLKLDGDLKQGVRVTLEIGKEDSRPSTEITAQLPPYVVTAIDQWQSTYRSLGQSSRLEAKKIVYGGSIAQWREDCDKSVVDLRSHLHNWLLSESFRPIREKWLQQLSPCDEVRMLIRTSSLIGRTNAELSNSGAWRAENCTPLKGIVVQLLASASAPTARRLLLQVVMAR